MSKLNFDGTNLIAIPLDKVREQKFGRVMVANLAAKLASIPRYRNQNTGRYQTEKTKT